MDLKFNFSLHADVNVVSMDIFTYLLGELWPLNTRYGRITCFCGSLWSSLLQCVSGQASHAHRIWWHIWRKNKQIQLSFILGWPCIFLLIVNYSSSCCWSQTLIPDLFFSTLIFCWSSSFRLVATCQWFSVHFGSWSHRETKLNPSVNSVTC